ncbi:MAG: chemotaxis protein CheW [Phycisphaerales bacterium]|nr:chemotaxis protein CheW [Phycisphaerales bacterium]
MTQAQTPAVDEATEDTTQSIENNSVVADDVTRYVVVEINKNMYGISTDCTVELMDSTMTQITRVSHAPPYVQGVINHRGSIIPAIDMRSLLSFKSHESEVQELSLMLAKCEKDHAEWLTELKSCVMNGESFTKAIEPTKCTFGKWYTNLRSNPALMEALTKGDNSLKSIVENIDEPHKRIHSIAKAVLGTNGRQGVEEATKIIDNAWDTDLAKLKQLFKSLIDTIHSTHTSMMIITEHGTQKIGLIVDEVHSVFDCPNNTIEALPDSTDNAQFLKGLVHQSDGSYILIADIEYIYEQTCPE